MQPASQGESGSLLITHLFKTINCLESSDEHGAGSSSGEGLPQKLHRWTLSLCQCNCSRRSADLPGEPKSGERRRRCAPDVCRCAGSLVLVPGSSFLH